MVASAKKRKLKVVGRLLAAVFFGVKKIDSRMNFKASTPPDRSNRR